ncbi:hypothetical protein EUGRSUZ_F03636 [Eucalyptus grandis]|uniref:Uncharacterized protein n=2 Tax=Eucalyptus grandis TaxID=71139 RepID=A0ACC3KN07_EUCGR|nr:hypothetical protein EUGRSUZ_F03636 [Eucalyptus grandis]
MEDDMDSLFEGMVLFTPSQLSDQPERDGADQRRLPDPIHRPPSPQPPADAAPAAAASEPLDENLFSDLTLVGPLPDLPENGHSPPRLSPSPSLETETKTASDHATTAREIAPSVTRQISRKKKRATGLRIGYGRDAAAATSVDRASPLPISLSSDANSVSVPDARSESNIDSSSSGRIDFSKSVSASQERESSDVTSLASQPNDRSLEVSEDLEEATEDPSRAPGTRDIDIIQHDARLVEEESALASEDTETTKHGDDGDEHTKMDDSVEIKFERIKTQIAEKLDLARELAASLSAAKKDCVRKRRKAAENVTLASTKHKELEKSMEEACEAEDFEMAEKVSESLAAAEKERQALVDALRASEAECDAIDAKMQEVLNAQIAAEDECVSLLENFSKDATASADLIEKKANLLRAEEMDKWLSSSEDLEVRKMELEIESYLISEARKGVNVSIEHSIDDDSREKEKLLKKKDVLLDELEKLLNLVREKEKEIAENDASIEAVEKRIAGVVSGFQDMQSDIGAKYDRMKSKLSQVDAESEALSIKKKDIDDILSQEDNKGAKIRELGRIAADEAKAYNEAAGLRKGLMLCILEYRESKLGLMKTEEKFSEDVMRLQQEASSARASLQELSSNKSSLQQEIASFEQRILYVDKRLPELETEKKVAAAARNFKEAARIAAEAKSLSNEKEGTQIKLERATMELGKLEEEIKETVDKLQEAEEQILLRERDLAVARFQRLLITASAANAERAAAVELGDHEEADTLLAEAKAAEYEAQKLQEVYDLKEEDFGNQPKHLIPMELVHDLSGKQLAELAASVHLTPAS